MLLSGTEFTLHRDWLYEVPGYKRQTHVDTQCMQSAEHRLHVGPSDEILSLFCTLMKYSLTGYSLYRSGHSFRTESEGSREAAAEGAESKFLIGVFSRSRASFASSSLNLINQNCTA